MSTIAPPSPRQRDGLDGCDPRPLTTRLVVYTTSCGERREVICLAGSAQTTLVIDRRFDDVGDSRLLAHLAADEPAENANRICEMYLADPAASPCRSLTGEDLVRAFGEGDCVVTNGHVPDEDVFVATMLTDRRSATYRLHLCGGCGSIAQLRWCRVAVENGQGPQPVSLRHVIGALESYEPARTLTLAALACYASDASVSVVALRGESERMSLSPIVLNRGLREAVERALVGGEVTMSEIAIRCGRMRRGERGVVSGETSWLARRIGHAPEAGHSQPTPWIHSDVLALIARHGLSLNPNEVEL